MAILGLQGVRGGVGTTSLTAALAWALQILGENVLVIDASPDNLLRMSFNVDFVHQGGWARSLLDGQDWRDAGLRYTSQLDLLPLDSSPRKSGKIRSPGRRRWERSDRLSRR